MMDRADGSKEKNGGGGRNGGERDYLPSFEEKKKTQRWVRREKTLDRVKKIRRARKKE